MPKCKSTILDTQKEVGKRVRKDCVARYYTVKHSMCDLFRI
jgi:hypothetical protein